MVIHLRGTNIPIFDDRQPGQGHFEVGIIYRGGGDGKLFVIAGPDPAILIADEFLHTLRHHSERAHPDINLQWWTDTEPCSINPPVGCCQETGLLALRGNNCFYDAVLTIDTTTGRIIYRIGTYDLEHRAWRAAWPD